RSAVTIADSRYALGRVGQLCGAHAACRGVVRLRSVPVGPPGRVRIERGVCIPTQVPLLSVPFIWSAAPYNVRRHIDEKRALTVGHSSLEEGRSNWTDRVGPTGAPTHPHQTGQVKLFEAQTRTNSSAGARLGPDSSPTFIRKLPAAYSMERKIPDFSGTWEMKSSENFEELLKALNVNVMLRKIAVKAASKPLVEITQDKETLSIKTCTTVRTTHITFTVGKEFNEATVDGRPCTSFPLWETDSKISCEQTLQKGEGPKTSWTREITNDGKLILTMSADDVICTRVYERQ
uniref:Cellular retinoic acid-binding protein 1 n=2 Tax=Seriola lalandi dorsalis TaxID=1841481 RepID=A0A3B4Y9M2_SERLL